MLARTMWLEHGMWVSCRRERGSISLNCNKLDFESVVQVNFAASDPTTMTTLGGAPRPTMFLWYLRARDTAVFQVCDRLV